VVLAITLAKVGNCCQLLRFTAAVTLVADMLVQGAARHSGTALTNVVAAFGQLRFRDEMVLDEISRHLITKVGSLDQEHLDKLVSRGWGEGIACGCAYMGWGTGEGRRG
jgi:hypothetical protein